MLRLFVSSYEYFVEITCFFFFFEFELPRTHSVILSLIMYISVHKVNG